MRRFALPTVIAALAAALLAVLGFGVAHSGPSGALDSALASGRLPPAPDAHLRLPLLASGARESLSTLRGHVVMVSFSAGWCDACQVDAPLVARAQRTLRRAGGTVLGVTFQDSSADALAYMHRYHLRYPVLRDPNGQLAAAYGVNGVPETFIVNARGEVVALRRYQLSGSWLAATLRKALTEPA